MNKEFLKYEQALALKELGFDEPCFGYYDTVAVTYLTYPSAINKNSDIENSLYISKQDKNVRCSAPLYQQAFRWFREKYGIFVSIVPSRYGALDSFIGWIYVPSNETTKDINVGDYEKGFSKPEEAELACLEKLIEIIKKK